MMNNAQSPSCPIDPDLAMAIRLSQMDQQKYEMDLKEEEDMLENVLKLSLEEK